MASHRTRFLNVDLDILSKRDLEPLVAALGRKVIVLHAGRTGSRYCAHLELGGVARTADAAIRAFCALIAALPKTEREWWDAAQTRDFNIGVQAGSAPHCREFAVSAQAVRAAAGLGARIVVTVYAPE